MQETIKNEEVISWLAGFYDAEGCFRVNRSHRRHGYVSYTPVAIVNNTDLVTMEYVIDLLLNKYDISGHVRNSTPTTNRSVCRCLEIARVTKVIDLCELLLPYAITKYDEVRLLRDFCVSRRDRFIEGGIKNNKLPYNTYEVDLYSKIVLYKAHKKGRACLSFIPIYTELPNDVTWSWLAGYTDGDGSFSINKRGSVSYCVATTNPSTSAKLGAFFKSQNINFLLYSTLPSKNHLQECKQRIHRYFINDVGDILLLIDGMKNYLVSKLEIAHVMMEYCNLRLGRKGTWRTDAEKEFVSKLSSLTQ